MKKIKKLYQLSKTIIVRGIIDLLFNRTTAIQYWKRILTAAMHYPQDDMNLLKLPVCELSEIFPEIQSTSINIVDYMYVYGDMPIHELVNLCQIVSVINPDNIFEIGTYEGGTTLQLAANSTGKIFTLDLDPEDNKVRDKSHLEPDVFPQKPGIRFKETKYVNRITQLYGDSRNYDFSKFCSEFNFVFIDACHEYDYVISDSRNALKILAPGGVAIWHDYASYAPGVIKALHELSKEISLCRIQNTSLVFHRNI